MMTLSPLLALGLTSGRLESAARDQSSWDRAVGNLRCQRWWKLNRAILLLLSATDRSAQGMRR